MGAGPGFATRLGNFKFRVLGRVWFWLRERLDNPKIRQLYESDLRLVHPN